MLLLEQHEVDGNQEIKDIKLEALGEVCMHRAHVPQFKFIAYNFFYFKCGHATPACKQGWKN